MKKLCNKKAISPVIATVLLITIAIIVVAIIWIWASRSIDNSETKFGTTLDQVCNELDVDISVLGNNIDIVNRESTYTLEGVTLKDDSGTLYPCTVLPIAPAASTSIPLSDCSGAGDVTIEKAIVVLKGDNGNIYNCDDNEIEV